MPIAEFLRILNGMNSPVGWFIIVVLFIGPIILGMIKNILQFHSENIRHFRVKHFDVALDALNPGSVEHRLLEECKAQELVFLNTRLRLSKPERAQILEWMTEKAITVHLIRKGWSAVKVKEDGVQLHVRVARVEQIYKWYMLVVAVVSFIAGLFALLEVREFGHLWLPGGLCLFGILAGRQAVPVLYGERLEYCVHGNRDDEEHLGAAGKITGHPPLS